MRSTRVRPTETALVAAAAALLTLGACRDPLDPPLPSAHPADETPRRGGTLHLASLGDATTLDPAPASDGFTMSVLRLLYAGLVDFDPSGRVVPDLAAAIELSDDARTYSFTLREGARFHDGTAVTAAEVKRSIERALHPDTPSAVSGLFDGIDGFADFEAKKSPHLAGVSVLGRSLLAIHLREPDAAFLELLALAPLHITCPSAGERFSPSFVPCGAGPFRLPAGAWKRGQSLGLVRNEDYFRPGTPYLDAVSWELNSTQFVQGLKLARGDLDISSELTQPETIRYRSDARWQPFGTRGSPSSLVQGDAMNTEIAPFDNVEIRRAVAAAIDRDHLVLLNASSLSPQTKPVPPLPGYDPPGIGQAHDLAAALEHMRKAGYAFDPATGRGGWPAPIPYDAYRPGIAEGTGQLVQQDLARIGLRIELRLSSFPTWIALTHRRGKSAMSPQGFGEDYPDPSDYLESRFATKAISEEDGLNSSFYSNARVDFLLVHAKRERDPALRAQMYAEVERIVCDEAPWAFEYSVRPYQVRQPYVRGFQPHAVWTIDVLPLWLDRQPDEHARRDAPLTRRLLRAVVAEGP